MSSSPRVLSEFFTELDNKPTALKLGNSMQNFLDAFRIINGIPFSNDSTRKFMFNGADIIPNYQLLMEQIETIDFEAGKVTVDGKVTINGKDELKMPGITVLDLETTPNTVIDVNFSFNAKNSDNDTLDYDISKGSRKLIYDDISSSDVDITFSTYVERVKQRMKTILDNKVFELYTTKLSNLKGVSMPNDAQNIYDTSLFDILMSFVDTNNFMLTTDIDISDTRRSAVFNHLNNINTFFFTMKEDGADDLNQMIININDRQMNIQTHKDSIRQVKEKLYTLMSRDKNYTTVLSYRRRQFYVFLVILAIVCSIYGFALASQEIDLNMKNYIVGSVAVVILVVQILSQLLGMVKQTRIKESFVEINKAKFTDVLQEPLFVKSSDTQITISYVLANFVDKYNENMTYEVKTEYYESITDKQSQDVKMLEQLHKENETQKHMHQLKNSLTYFKINETREYTSYVTYALILSSMLSILYLAVLNNSLERNIFVVAGTLSVVLYITYVLLSVKSIMVRDKYDWDRLNWTMNNIKGNSNQERCTLPGR